jgi:hypothetical protein
MQYYVLVEMLELPHSNFSSAICDGRAPADMLYSSISFVDIFFFINYYMLTWELGSVQ